MQQLDENGVAIKSSILAAKTINHDIDLDALNGDKGSVPVVRVDSDVSFEEPSIGDPLLDLLFNLDIFLVVDSLLGVSLFVFLPRLLAFPHFELLSSLTINETLLLTNTFLNFFLLSLFLLRSRGIRISLGVEVIPELVALPLFLLDVESLGPWLIMIGLVRGLLLIFRHGLDRREWRHFIEIVVFRDLLLRVLVVLNLRTLFEQNVTRTLKEVW